MTNPHIAFISFPHPPEVNPTIPIAAVLVRRGYRVTYVTSDRFAGRIAATGADVIRCPSFSPRGMYASAQEMDASPVERLAIGTMEAVTPILEREHPALIVYDALALAGRILSTRWEIPAVQTTPIFALDSNNLHIQIPNREYRNSELMFSKMVDAFLESQGIRSSDFMFHKEKLNLYLFPKFMQIRGSDLGSESFFAGRCAAEQPHFGSWKKPSCGRPSILISNSTTFSSGGQFFRTCIQALAGDEFHLVLSIGDIPPDSLGRLPPHCEIVRDTSHVQILPHMSLFICPGGIVTQTEALYHGVPMMAVSNGFPELEWVCENVPRLGVGVHVRKDEATVSGIRQAVHRLRSDSAIRAAVARLQKRVRGDAGGEETANVIEEYLNS